MNDHVNQSQISYSLSTCDLEPIHTPGRIQPFGVLLAGPATLDSVWYCSANTEDVFGIGADATLDSSFKELLGVEVVHDLRNLLNASTARTQRERLGRFLVNTIEADIYAHLNPEGIAVVEIEPVVEDPTADGESAIDRMRKVLGVISAREDLDSFLNAAVQGLRALTGYDRVMAYRYEPNGDGIVVAEALDDGIDSFLGLRYPAWDVPEQARALQVKNPLRMLTDVRQTPVPIYATDRDTPPLDMALAHMRGISPIHVEYLANMGVGATMSIGLVIDGRLWGMFACHHMTPRLIPSEMRVAVELLGQMISMIIKQKQDLEATFARKAAAEARQRILAETDAQADLLNAFPDLAPILLSVIDADGMAIIREDKVLTTGSTPPPEAIRALAELRPNEEDLIEASDNLVADQWLADIADNPSAGALLVRATSAFPLQLIYFRDEIARKVTWAGAPEKEMEEGPDGPRISPRKSFASYLEQQRGYCPRWSEADLVSARELQILMTQITAKGERLQMLRHRDLVSHQRQQDLMIAELNHRVKNILALIRSLSRQARDSSASLESYALSLEQRIAALASAHDLAVSNSMTGVSLRSIFETELLPYLTEDNMQVLMSGPVTGLRADVAPMIALVVHEIVSNAVKYGALSTADGVVKANWSVSDGHLRFTWKEIGGPAVAPPTRNGFGRSLIEKVIPYELDGEAQLTFSEQGVRFEFTLPESVLVELKEEQPEKAAKPVGTVTKIGRIADGTTVLLVEDNMILAMDMLESLSRLGAENVDTAGSVDKALDLVRKGKYDFAVLDMNLRGEVSFDIAMSLREKGTPFLFVTGYGSSINLPPDLVDVAILTKPIDEATLSRGIANLLDR